MNANTFKIYSNKYFLVWPKQSHLTRSIIAAKGLEFFRGFNVEVIGGTVALINNTYISAWFLDARVGLYNFDGLDAIGCYKGIYSVIRRPLDALKYTMSDRGYVSVGLCAELLMGLLNDDDIKEINNSMFAMRVKDK